MNTFWEIAADQGWTDDSVLDVALGFIISTEQEQALAEYAQHVADQENSR